MKILRRGSFCTLLLLVASLVASAEQLSVSEALRRATLSTEGRAIPVARALASVSASGASTTTKPLYTATAVDDSDTRIAYVMRAGSGFVVVSADTRLAPVLGYGSSVPDSRDIPETFLGWMQTLGEALSNDQTTLSDYDAHTSLPVGRSDIEPLLRSKWNQDDPFNQLCPTGIYRNGPSPTNQSPVGCVATAMSQVMRYHRWPLQGSGKAEYYWDNDRYGTSGTKYAVEPGRHTYLWDQMLDDYNGDYTPLNASAVAMLAYDCAVTTFMQWLSYGSGTSDIDMARALVENFGYSPSVRTLIRDAYTDSEWDSIIYVQLRDVGPVLYSAVTIDEEGHQFVCDGYDASTGFFHFNWGWGGLCDGFYKMSALNPQDQGIGGSASSYAFNLNHHATIDVRPPRDGDVPAPQFFSLIQPGCITASDRYMCGNPYTWGSKYLYYGATPVTGIFGLRVRDREGNVKFETGSTQSTYNPGIQSKIFGAYTFSCGISVPDSGVGTYHVTPAFLDQSTGQWSVIRTVGSPVTGCTGSIKINVTSDDANYSYKIAPSIDKLTFGAPRALTPIYTGMKVRFGGVVANNSTNTSRTVTYRWVLTDSSPQPRKFAYSDLFTIEIAPDQVYHIDDLVSLKMIEGSPVIAPVRLTLMNESWETLTEDVTVEVLGDSTGWEGNAVLTLLGDDPTEPGIESLRIKTLLNITSGYINSGFRLGLYERDDNDSAPTHDYTLIQYVDIDTIIAAAGQSRQFESAFDDVELKAGHTYCFRLLHDGKPVEDAAYTFAIQPEETTPPGSEDPEDPDPNDPDNPDPDDPNDPDNPNPEDPDPNDPEDPDPNDPNPTDPDDPDNPDPNDPTDPDPNNPEDPGHSEDEESETVAITTLSVNSLGLVPTPEGLQCSTSSGDGARLVIYSSTGSIRHSATVSGDCYISLADLEHGIYVATLTQGKNTVSVKFLH